MAHEVFICYVEEDGEFARGLAEELMQRGYRSWYFQLSPLKGGPVPGVGYLEQMAKAIKEAQAFLLVISPSTFPSQQVNSEVVRAQESGKPFFPVLLGVSLDEVARNRPGWSTAIADAGSIGVPPLSRSEITDCIMLGFAVRGIDPDREEDKSEIGTPTKIGEAQRSPVVPEPTTKKTDETEERPRRRRRRPEPIEGTTEPADVVRPIDRDEPDGMSPIPLEDLVKASGLKYTRLESGSLVVAFKAERARQLAVQITMLKDDTVLFLADIPEPGFLGQEAALRSLLRISFQANYVKALTLSGDAFDVAFAAELPAMVLSPQVVEGLVRGLANLADVNAGDLAKWQDWERRLTECTVSQATRIKVDVEQAEKTIPGLAEAAGLPCRRTDSGSFVVEWEIGGSNLKLVIRPREPVISCIVYFADVKPKGDKKKYMRGLLELNRAANVAKVGLDGDGDVALMYEVPQVFPDLLEKVRAQMGMLLLGVVALAEK